VGFIQFSTGIFYEKEIYLHLAAGSILWHFRICCIEVQLQNTK